MNYSYADDDSDGGDQQNASEHDASEAGVEPSNHAIECSFVFHRSGNRDMRKQCLLAVGLCFASTAPLDAAIPLCATEAQRSTIQAAMADPAKPAPYRVAAKLSLPESCLRCVKRIYKLGGTDSISRQNIMKHIQSVGLESIVKQFPV